MRSLRLALTFALFGLAHPLPAQYLNANGEVQILVPRAPLVNSQISKLLLLPSFEAESLLVAKALQETLASNPHFKVSVSEGNDTLSHGITGLGTVDRAQCEAIATTYGASHLMLITLGRFEFKEKQSREIIQTANGKVTMYKWLGLSRGQLQCPVLELRTGSVTASVPQNLAKEYYKEEVGFVPLPEILSTARADIVKIAARKALQMVVAVQEIRPLPFMTQGALETIYKLLKTGNLNEALRAATLLAAASTEESPKFKARIQYDIGILQLLANRPELALEALHSAQEAGYDKKDVTKALDACKSILVARATSA